MSTQVSSSKQSNSALESSRFDQYVRKQLNQTSGQVKLVDLMSSLMMLAAIVLGTLLAVCIVDAWISPLGSVARLVVLVSIIGVSVYFLLFRIAPLLIRKINPAYAAKVIENSKPSLKNSLLNYLFIRENKRHRTRVYQAVQQQAANDLSAVALESTVDRSNLIRIGFALVAVVVVAGMYKLLSPKDPVQTLARVVAPLADIQKPSQIRVFDVRPGDADVFFGQTLEVTANVRGIGKQQDVLLVYSTDDGQFVDSVIQMTKGDSRYEYRCQLQTSAGGIQHSLRYQIIAGDGESAEYRVTTRPNPTITVQTVDYLPPKYTELPPRSTAGNGEIQGLEGTRVKITARANMDISHAFLELLSVVTTDKSEEKKAGPPLPAEYRLVKQLAMAATGQSATAEFVLQRDRGTNRAKHSHYRLMFSNSEGESNRHQVVYPIRVNPDIAPEIEIVEPVETETKIPFNRTLRIKIRAVDPDFKIKAIQFEGSFKGGNLIRQNLPLGKQAGIGNVDVQFDFQPANYKLSPGDQVTYYAVASDNRMSSLSDVADPNRTRTDNYTVTISEPVDGKDPLQSKSDQSGNDNADVSSEQNDSGDSGSKGNSGGSDDSSAEQKPGEKSDSNQSGGGGAKSESAQDAEPSDEKSEGGKSGKSNNSQGNSSESDSTDSSPSEPGDGKSDQKKSESNSDRSPGDNNDPAEANENDANSEGSEAGKPANDQKMSEGDPKNDGDTNADSNASSTNQNSNESRMSEGNGDLTDDSTDAERIQKTLDFLNKKEEQDKNNENSSKGDDPPQKPENSDNNREPKSPDSKNETSDSNPEGANSSENKGTEESGNDAESNNESSNSKNPSQENSDGKSDGKSDEKSDGKSDGKSDDKTGDKKDESVGESSDPGDKAEGPEKSSSNGSDSKDGKSDSTTDQAESADKSDQKSDSNENSENRSDDKSNSSDSDDKNSDSEGSNPGEKSDKSDSSTGSDDKSDDKSAEGSDKTSEKNSDSSSDSEGGENDKNQGAESKSSEKKADSSKSDSDSNSDNKNSNGNPSDDSKNSEGSPESENESNSTGSNKPSGTGHESKDDRTLSDPLDPDVIPPDEQERIEFAKKATDLVLDYLKDQKDGADPELLEELNFSEDEMREFQARWQRLRDKAEKGTARDKKRYNDALRSLGLRSIDSRTGISKSRRDKISGLNEDGAVIKLPPKHAEGFRHFQKGRSRADNQ